GEASEDRPDNALGGPARLALAGRSPQVPGDRPEHDLRRPGQWADSTPAVRAADPHSPECPSPPGLGRENRPAMIPGGKKAMREDVILCLSYQITAPSTISPSMWPRT